MRHSKWLLVLVNLALLTPCFAPAGSFENYVIPSWGDLAWNYGPGTDPAMDSPEAIEHMIKIWQGRGVTGLMLRTDLIQFDDPKLLRINPPRKREPKLAVIWNSIDQISARFDVHEYGVKLSRQLGFEFWAYHPHIYSDGAPEDAGSPGPGRLWPWSYEMAYMHEHPEIITVDRKGKKYWMVREYAYPGARSSKVAEFVYMAKKYHVQGFVACMRSEASQLQDPADKADRYGFNAPVVEDMKRLYGVDILTDPRFDVDDPKFNTLDPMVEKWHDLRGSYVTQFYRELRQALREVDPKLRLAVTLSGDHIGPPLGNWRLDWRKWVDEGLVDMIISPVFFEATLDLHSQEKGYLTDAKNGKGTVPFSVLKDYIAKSPHPEIKLISGGGAPYELRDPPQGADGWRTDIWYSAYHLAWYQRWEQWKRDLKELGYIRFFDQNFDDFPVNSIGHSGGWGDARYNPQLRACPGSWARLGDGTDARPVAQEKIHHGNAGRAMKLTRSADGRGRLAGWHASSPDRSNITWCLDTCIANGETIFDYWLYRESEQSALAAYLQDSVPSYSHAEIEGEKDVGLKVMPQTGKIFYASGTNWLESGYSLPVGQWQKFSLKVNLDTLSYSARAGEDAGIDLCKNIAIGKAKPRFVEQACVNVPVSVPGYRTFSQVLFIPEGNDGNMTYLDDVSVKWVPSMYYQPAGSDVYFSDDFENDAVNEALDNHPALLGGKWKVSPPVAQNCFIDNHTSFGEGVMSLHARGGAEFTAITDRKLAFNGKSALTVDLDVFIRSESSFPYLMPNPLTKSKNRTAISVKSANGKTPLLGVFAGDGTWEYWDGSQYQDSKVKIAYDVWNHLQIALEPGRGTYQVVVQPVGELPTLAAHGARLGKGDRTDVVFTITPSNTTNHNSLYDNIVITK